jgi:hypothetical protein
MNPTMAPPRAIGPVQGPSAIPLPQVGHVTTTASVGLVGTEQGQKRALFFKAKTIDPRARPVMLTEHRLTYSHPGPPGSVVYGYTPPLGTTVPGPLPHVVRTSPVAQAPPLGLSPTPDSPILTRNLQGTSNTNPLIAPSAESPAQRAVRYFRGGSAVRNAGIGATSIATSLLDPPKPLPVVGDVPLAGGITVASLLFGGPYGAVLVGVGAAARASDANTVLAKTGIIIPVDQAILDHIRRINAIQSKMIGILDWTDP